MTIADVAERQWLTIIGCGAVEHAVRLTPADLVARFPLGATLGQVAERLVCAKCGSKTGEIGFTQDTSPPAITRGMRRDLDTAPPFRKL